MNIWATWKLVTRITLVVGGLFSLLAVLQLLQFFFALHQFSPVLGWWYLIVLLVGSVWSIGYVIMQLNRHPKPLLPPPYPEPDQATHTEWKRYTRYLLRYLQRLVDNAALTADCRQQLADEIETTNGFLHHHPLNEDFARFIQKCEKDLLPAAHRQLHTHAEREIRRSVRDVMLGVSLSPYHHIDLLIVLYRNAAMIFRIMDVYATTPTPRAQWRIVRDVVRVMATVNFLYVGRNLIENLFSFIPWVGRMADDIGQGLGAGLFTSACGHAVIERCSSYRNWEKTAAVDSLAAQSKDFLRDVRNIFTKDVLPDIKNRLLAEAPPDKVQEPGFWENLQKGVNNAFDATLRTVGQIMP